MVAVAAAASITHTASRGNKLPQPLLDAIQQYIAWEPNEEFRKDASRILLHHRQDDVKPPSEQPGYTPSVAADVLSRSVDDKEAPTESELEKQFLTRLEFGTAGLRGRMGSGFGCMNVLTVMQAAQGLCTYITERFPSETNRITGGFVIGFDGRHHSKQFAHTVAAVFLSRGVHVRLFRGSSPTPLVPYAVAKFKACGGAQLTASHNPKWDNGFKVYNERGAQIITPADRLIMERIEANLAPWPAALALLDTSSGLLRNDIEAVGRKSTCGILTFMDTSGSADTLSSYVEDVSSALLAAIGNPSANSFSTPKVVYTALHGVGYPAVCALLNRCGFNVVPDGGTFYSVAEQQDPDPEFSTVPFPNPEERGALDMALALASRVGAPMVIANDPDADRFAAAELIVADSSKQNSPRWHVFKGDELGVLFGAYFLERLTKDRGADPKQLLFVNSAVSSEMIQAVATAAGCQYAQTLTGFKWMMNRCLDIVDCSKATNSTTLPVLVYEEALGYSLTPALVPDKDGVAAAAAWMIMVADTYARGGTMLSRLRDLQTRFGVYVSNNGYFICHDRAALVSIFQEMRAAGKYFSKVGPFSVARIVEPTTGYDSAATDRRCALPQTNEGQMLTIYFESGAKITLRTSGTEPKLKWYSELSGADEAGASTALQQVVDACIEHLLQPHKYPLQRPSPK